MIVRLPDQQEMERCSTPGYEHCPDAGQYRIDVADSSHCPFLQESLVQYCSAAPIVKYIPYTDSRECRCTTGQHSSCDLFRAMAGPMESTERSASGPEAPPETPEGLLFSENHMWLDSGSQRLCRVGVDAFLAGTLRSVDSVEFLTRRGRSAPSATLISDGTRVALTFPVTMMITSVNSWLRTRPSRVLDDPYGSGWLFEGLDPDDAGAAGSGALIPGPSAAGWMRSETLRMTDFVHGLVRTGDGYSLMADGGEYQQRLFPHLDQARRQELIARFFTVRGGGRGAR